MVSAKLLAELDMQLRGKIRSIARGKRTATGEDRPFGGLNILCAGDLWQLDPPDGGFIGSIPVQYIQRGRKYQPAATVSHGQALVWGGRMAP